MIFFKFTLNYLSRMEEPPATPNWVRVLKPHALLNCMKVHKQKRMTGHKNVLSLHDADPLRGTTPPLPYDDPQPTEGHPTKQKGSSGSSHPPGAPSGAIITEGEGMAVDLGNSPLSLLEEDRSRM